MVEIRSDAHSPPFLCIQRVISVRDQGRGGAHVGEVRGVEVMRSDARSDAAHLPCVFSVLCACCLALYTSAYPSTLVFGVGTASAC